MKSLLYFALLYTLYPGILACFEEGPLEPSLQQYLALNKNCEDTLFPQPSCCGVSREPAHRIMNGTVTGRTEFTWTVHIYMTFQNLTTSEPSTYHCGGSLINPLWVISAAHCFVKKDLTLSDVQLYVGEWDVNALDTNVVEVPIPLENIVEHPKYNSKGIDLALVRMQHPVTYSEFIKPICLPFNPLKSECFTNKEAVATGWGKDESGKSSKVKRKTTLTVMECSNRPDFICAMSNGTNSACHGDSGGPLSFKLPNSEYFYLLGATKTGHTECVAKKNPNIYTKIDMEWMIKIILNDDTRKQY